MKNLPKSINVFGRKIKIDTKPNPLIPSNIHGYYESETGTIHISSGGMETLLHEIFHAVIDRVSVNQTLSQEVEEIIVDTFAKQINETFDLKFKK